LFILAPLSAQADRAALDSPRSISVQNVCVARTKDGGRDAFFFGRLTDRYQTASGVLQSDKIWRLEAIECTRQKQQDRKCRPGQLVSTDATQVDLEQLTSGKPVTMFLINEWGADLSFSSKTALRQHLRESLDLLDENPSFAFAREELARFRARAEMLVSGVRTSQQQVLRLGPYRYFVVDSERQKLTFLNIAHDGFGMTTVSCL